MTIIIKNFKTILVVFLAALISGCASTGGGTRTGLPLQNAIEQSAEKTAEELPGGSRVAVVAFESSNDNLSDFIMEEITGELFDRGFEIADRKNIKFVLQELMFQQTDYVDENTARYLGKFVMADEAVSGELTDLTKIYRYRTVATNVNTKVPTIETSLEMPADREMRRMLTAISNNKTVLREYTYGDVAAQRTAGTFLDRGLTFFIKTEYDEAIRCFNEVIRLKPNAAMGYFFRGLSYQYKKNYDLGLADFDHAIRLDPDFPWPYYFRGNFYFILEDLDRAIPDFETALRLDPNLPFIRKALDIARRMRALYQTR